MKKYFLLPLLLFLFAELSFAVSVSYDITINGIVDTVLFNQTKNEVKECENKCIFSIPVFEVPENFTFNNYTLSNPSELIKNTSFESNQQLTSVLFTDKVIIETIELKEELKIGRLVTKNLNLGQNNLVLQLENIGNKDIKNAYIQISGDGIKTISTSTVDIPKGQTDFVTAIVSITNHGNIDIIIKAFSNEKLLGQVIENIYVYPPTEEPTIKPETVNATYAQTQINNLWKMLNEYEKDYFSKKSEGYNIPDITDSINEAKKEIKNLELGYSTLTQEEFDKKRAIIERGLADIKLQLDLAAPKKITDTLKENLGLIATTIGVIVSTLTAFGLAKGHLSSSKNKKNELKKK